MLDKNFIAKSFGIDLQKGRKSLPIGSISKDGLHKKVAEGKWIKISKLGNDNSKEDIDNLKKEYIDARILREKAISKVEELQSKGYHLPYRYNREINKREKRPPFKKQMMDRAYREVEKANKNLYRIIYSQKIVKNILSKLNIKSSKYSSTAIRDYNTISQSGYEFSEGQDTLMIVGSENNKFNKLLSELKDLNLVESFSEPSKTIGFGLVSSIKLKKINIK